MDELNGMVPQFSFRKLIKVFLQEQVVEGMIVSGNHFFKGPFWFLSICGHSQVIAQMISSSSIWTVRIVSPSSSSSSQ